MRRQRSQRSEIRRRTKRSRTIKRAVVVMRILAWISGPVGIILLTAGLLLRNGRMALLGGCYTGVSVVLLILWHMTLMAERAGEKRRESATRVDSFGTSDYPLNAKQDGGVALIMTILVLGVLSGVVMQSQILARDALVVSSANVRQWGLRAAAADAVWQALQMLSDDENPGVDTIEECRAMCEAIVPASDCTTEVTVVDRSASFDINNVARRLRSADANVSETVLRRILTTFEHPEPDRVLQTLVAHARTNGLVSGWSELGRLAVLPRRFCDRRKPIVGRPAGDAARFSDCVTIVPGSGLACVSVNVNTARPETLRALLGPRQEQTVRSILRRRRQYPFETVAQIGEHVTPELFRTIKTYLDVRSRLFAVAAVASRDGVSRQVLARVVRDGSGRVTIAGWVQN